MNMMKLDSRYDVTLNSSILVRLCKWLLALFTDADGRRDIIHLVQFISKLGCSMCLVRPASDRRVRVTTSSNQIC